MKLRRVLVIFGVLCLVAALSLTVYNLIEATIAGNKAASVAQRLSEDISKNGDSQEDEPVPTMVIDGVKYLGYLKVPKLKLTLPVAAEYKYEQLYTSPALYFGAFPDGNAVVAAHNYNAHFARLRRLEVGDEILFIDANDKKYRYTVGWQENILASDREHMIDDNGWDLTLFTCSYTKGVRYTLRCLSAEE